MTYGVDIWVPDPETGGKKTEIRFPCTNCKKLSKEIYVINDSIQLCSECNSLYIK